MSSTAHIMDSGRVVDPASDKNLAHWRAERDPPPDVDCITFVNEEIGFFSYDPPRGFTVEEIMQFQGADECLTAEKVERLIKKRDVGGGNELRGVARWKL